MCLYPKISLVVSIFRNRKTYPCRQTSGHTHQILSSETLRSMKKAFLPRHSVHSDIRAFADSTSEWSNSINDEEEGSDTEQDLEESLLELSSDDNDQLSSLTSGTAHITQSTAASRSSFLEKWERYKLVADSIDKNFRASYQRIDRTSQSFHYSNFHVYGVLDRVDFYGISDVVQGNYTVDPVSVLPNDADLLRVKRDMCLLISR